MWDVYGQHASPGDLYSGAIWSLSDEGQIVAAGSRLTVLELTDDSLTGNSPEDNKRRKRRAHLYIALNEFKFWLRYIRGFFL